METFQLFYTEEKPLFVRKAYKFRASLKKFKRSLMFFYGIKKTKSAFRKLALHRRTGTMKRNQIKFNLI